LASSAEGGGFVANDCTLHADDRLWLLTGPNMAGKSTFLRQNALIAILAQMGGFVPAVSAEIGIVDRLFSRVGAADDRASGRSTFMVEMVETAAILNQATPRSLVILDEIGRGTATYDGVSIAWATVEHLHDQVRCRALFATHYHELTALDRSLAALSCHTMSIKEWQGDIVFLHMVVPGTAERSYGVHVARLAGLPPTVIKRAEAVLKQIESGGDARMLKRPVDDLPLFSSAQPVPPARVEEPSPLEPLGNLLAGTDPDTLTPRDALDLVYRLRKLLP
jgi:DNA mismatch repair protein MutS